MIGIITDSTCDIPESLIKQYGIVVLPQMIIWDNQQYRDRIDMEPEEFYQRLISDPERPTSSQVGIPDFKQAYEKLAEQGASEIIVLTVSGAMSGTYQNAVQAAKLVNIPVHVIDSKGPTMSLGWQVLAAARAREEGMDIKGILNRINQVRERLVQYISLESLEYLQKGGRIGGAIKWVGSKLQVKPLVSVNLQSGLVEAAGLARTHRHVVEMLYKKFFDGLKSYSNLHIAVLHGNVATEAEALAKKIQDEFHPVELIVNITGPVLGLNTGPGALALCGYAEE